MSENIENKVKRAKELMNELKIILSELSAACQSDVYSKCGIVVKGKDLVIMANRSVLR